MQLTLTLLQISLTLTLIAFRQTCGFYALSSHTARRSLSSTVVSANANANANATSTDNICLLAGLLKCVKQVFVDTIWWTYNVHLYKICGYCNTCKTLFHETIADEVFFLPKQTKPQGPKKYKKSPKCGQIKDKKIGLYFWNPNWLSTKIGIKYVVKPHPNPEISPKI